MSRVTFQLERPSSQVVGSSPPSPVRPTPISSMRASTIRNRRSRVESISMNGSTPTQTPAVVTPTAVSGSTAEVSKYSRSHIFFEPEFPELGPQHNQVKDAFKGISVKPPRKQKGIPPTIVETQMQPAKKDLAEVWRSHGKVFRANLVVHDEAKGGNIFTLSNNCSIDRYYKVAGRVSIVSWLLLLLLLLLNQSISISNPPFSHTSSCRSWRHFFPQVLPNHRNSKNPIS